jgi:hypothetical protein
MSLTNVVEMPSTERMSELDELYDQFDVDAASFGIIREVWNVNSVDKDENADVVRAFMAIQDLAQSPLLKDCSLAHFVTACINYTEYITRVVVNDMDAAAKNELLSMLRA